MAMTVANNNTAALALCELNKNTNKLAKDLKKVSSGARLTSAGDGAADYAISERMRVLTRALNQDIENVKKGVDLVKIAEKGIDDIIDELRTMKEMAIDSLNGHHSDSDRAMLQKMFAERIKSIDETATTTNYNGKILLDGRYWFEEAVEKIRLINSSENNILNDNSYIIDSNEFQNYINPSLNFMTFDDNLFNVSLKTNVEPIRFFLANTSDDTPLLYPTDPPTENQIQGLFPQANATSRGGLRGYSPTFTSSWQWPSDRVAVNTAVTRYGSYGVELYSEELRGSVVTYNKVELGKGTELDPYLRYFIAERKGYYISRYIPVKLEFDANDQIIISKNGENILSSTAYGYKQDLDFSSATINGNPINLPKDLNNQSISILCQGCYQFVSIKFETNRPAGTGVLFTADSTTPGSYKNSQVYVVGIGNDESMTQSEILRNVFKGIQNAQGISDDTATSVKLVNDHHSVTLKYDSESDTYSLWKLLGPPPVFYNGGLGTLTGGGEEIYGVDGGGDDTLPGGDDTIPSGEDTLPGGDDTVSGSDETISGGEDTISDSGKVHGDDITDKRYITFEEKYFDGNPLIIHHGPKANQQLEIYINDMRTKAMGITDAAIDPEEKAKEALQKLDSALEYALNESTRMGAYQMRLFEIADKLIAEHENTIASESVIRDADMAKEMAKFTKHKLLTQSAEAMLAQANQNAGSALGLLG